MVFCNERVDYFGQVAGEYVLEAIESEVDAVISDAALRKIVGPDSLRSITATNQIATGIVL